MNTEIISKTYKDLPFCQREIMRYAGCSGGDEMLESLYKECVEQADAVLSYHVCYRRLELEVKGDLCDFSVLSLRSEKLAQNLGGCHSVILFAATVGVGIDRLIAKYSRLSPAKALMFQAIGAAQVEALCDRFSADILAQYSTNLRPRFSPGYADLPLSAQREIFAVLDCERRIGLTLNESLLMSPTKSVTAFMGLTEGEQTIKNSCMLCDKIDCVYRGV